MSRPEVGRARAFLQRADAGLAAVCALEALDKVPDEIVGFHGQQAAEKLLKAVLAAHPIESPRTHSIRFLLDLLDDHGLAPLRISMRHRALPVRRPAPIRGAAQ
jgi:HEPN domain-containing protein